MPFNGPGDQPGYPPPPEDRPWRHPSELGPNAPGGGSGPGGTGPGLPPHVVTGPGAPLPRTGGRSWMIGVLGFLVGAMVTLTAVVGFGGFRKSPPEPAGVERVQTNLNASPQAPIALAERVIPSVARIDATGAKGTSTGTAVVFRANSQTGYLITTADLLDGADAIVVTLADGTPHQAQFVGSDRESDVAVVRVDVPGLQTVVLGRPASKLQLGEPVIAVESSPTSSPQRGASNVPVGVINGLGQRLESDDASRKTLYGMIKTNLRLTSSATGAPLIDANTGAMLGIITSRGYRAPSDANPIQGVRAKGPAGTTEDPVVRFATPIDYANDVAGMLIRDGRVPRPWLGITGTALSDDEAKRDGVSGGLKINNVDDNSPAADAKLKVDDVLLSVDDQPITSWDDLQITLRQHRPGDYVTIYYLRDGERQPTYASLTERNPGG